MTNAYKSSQDEVLNQGQFEATGQCEFPPDLQQTNPICAKCGVTKILSGAGQLTDGPTPSINRICGNCWVAAMHKSSQGMALTPWLHFFSSDEGGPYTSGLSCRRRSRPVVIITFGVGPGLCFLCWPADRPPVASRHLLLRWRSQQNRPLVGFDPELGGSLSHIPL